MIPRILKNNLTKALGSMPVVALLGSRQVGKTTLALEIAKITFMARLCGSFVARVRQNAVVLRHRWVVIHR